MKTTRKTREEAKIQVLLKTNKDLNVQLASSAKSRLSAQTKQKTAAQALAILSSSIEYAITKLSKIPSRSNSPVESRVHLLSLEIQAMRDGHSLQTSGLGDEILGLKEKCKLLYDNDKVDQVLKREKALEEKCTGQILKYQELESMFTSQTSVSEYRDLRGNLDSQLKNNELLKARNSALTSQIEAFNAQILLLKEKIEESARSYNDQIRATDVIIERLNLEKAQLLSHSQALESRLKLLALKGRAEEFDQRHYTSFSMPGFSEDDSVFGKENAKSEGETMMFLKQEKSFTRRFDSHLQDLEREFEDM